MPTKNIMRLAEIEQLKKITKDLTKDSTIVLAIIALYFVSDLIMYS